MVVAAALGASRFSQLKSTPGEQNLLQAANHCCCRCELQPRQRRQVDLATRLKIQQLFPNPSRLFEFALQLADHREGTDTTVALTSLHHVTTQVVWLAQLATCRARSFDTTRHDTTRQHHPTFWNT